MTVAPAEMSGSARADAARLLGQRYRDDALPLPAIWNPVLATLLAHRSVRAYRPDPLPPGTLELLVAAAQSASTSSNLQTWSVVAVEDPGRKARLAEFAGGQAHVRDCPLFLVWLADLSRIDRLAAERGTAAEGLDFLEALILGIVDAALAAQSAVVALESLGLGSVFIGGMRNRPEDVAAELGLPPHAFAAFGLCVGYPDPARPADIKPRLPQAAVLHREQYDRDAQRAPIADYDQRLRTFQQEQGMRSADWSALVVDRMRTPQSLTGRDRLTAALSALGFPLR